MTQNVGSTDRLIRIGLAIVIAALGVYFQSWLGLIALVPLGTALIGWCPAYVPLGIRTCKLK